MKEHIKIYDKEAIKFAEETNYTKATMKTVYEDLEKLRDASVKFYNDYIYWLNYYKADAPYFGWTNDNPEYVNMCEMTKEIQTLFLKMYIIAEKGLGNELELNK